jgi:hypothetical protein
MTFFDSPEYRPWKELRERLATFDIFIFDDDEADMERRAQELAAQADTRN